MKKAFLLVIGIVLMVLAPLVLITATAYTMTLPRMYDAEAKIALHEDHADPAAFIRQGKDFIFNPLYLRAQFAIMESRQILFRVIENLNLTKEWGKKINEDKAPISRDLVFCILKDSVRVQPYRDTSLIVVRVRMEDGCEAALVANEIVKVYRDYRLEQKRAQRNQGFEAVANEMERQQEKVNMAEEALARVRKDLKLTAGGSPPAIDQKKLATMQGDLMVAKVDMLTRKARWDQIKGLNDEDLLSAQQFIMGDAALSRLRQQLMDTQVTLKLMLENLGENHPDVKRLKTNQDELRIRLRLGMTGMKKGLEADWQVSKARYEVLEQELNAIKESEVALRPEDSIAYNRAERKLETERGVVTALKVRLTQTEGATEPPRTPVELIDPAQPSMVPVSPNLFLNMMVALGVALSLGFAGLISVLVGVASGRKKTMPPLAP